MQAQARKIIYIAGIGRSGSTIIDDILGQAEGFFSAGEAWDVWNQGCEEPCSCGKPLKECSVWIAIFQNAYGRAPAEMDFAQALRLSQRIDRLRHLWWLATPPGRALADRSGSFSHYIDLTRRLYSAMFAVSGARVVVDSSKAPSHAYLLERIGLADLYVVHLVRDSRAVAHSWSKPKGKWPPRGLIRTCMEWNANNALCQWLWRGRRYLRVAYEQFTAHPRDVLQEILEFAGEPQTSLPFVSPRTVELRGLHGYGGAPGRYVGRIDIVPDTRWGNEMRLSQKLAATAMTFPGLLWYGYAPALSASAIVGVETHSSRMS